MSMRLLAVDDELPALADLVRMLEASPAVEHVESAASADEALVALGAGRRIDAVFLDVRMPGLDGLELARVLRRFEDPPAVVFVSAFDDAAVSAFELAALDYLVKPVSRELLLESIGRLTFTTKVRSRTVTALVIDADPAAPARYRQLLEPDGFRVIAAVDGASGRRRAVDDRPDLILVDAILPDVDGLELASMLRHDPRTAAIPVWVSTPEGLAADAKAHLNGNVQGILASGDEALGALRDWLQAGRPAPTFEATA